MGISLKNKENWEGKILDSKNFGKFQVLEYRSTNEVIIKFLDTGTVITASLGNIKKGSVKDCMRPNVYEVGFIGYGLFSSRTNGSPQFTSYKRWKEMLARCYDPKNPNYPNYGELGVTVCDEWLNYQNYAKWYQENCTNDSFVLDKDILHKGSKVYSPENCCFVPNEINIVLTGRRHCRGDYPIGVSKKGSSYIAQINYMGSKKHLGSFTTVEEAFNAYKKAKEKCLKEYADKFKDVIDEKVYEALYSYSVEITD